MRNLFPELPLLTSLALEHRCYPEVAEVALVCVQHLLDTTGSLIEAFIALGFVPHQIHVLGKLYSTRTPVPNRLRSLGVRVYPNGTNFSWGQYSQRLSDDVAAMWQTAILTGAFDHVKKIVVLDDGGRNIQAVPPALLDSKLIVGVEQTMNGITLNRSKLPLIPFIAVGSSAAKLLIEPPIIRDSCLRSVAERVPLQSGTAGVVGLGNIGRAVSEGLQAVGVEVFTYDRRSDRTTHSSGRACATLTSLYQSSDTIWGCTGADHLSGHPWKQYIENVKDLISCSSTDSEFRTTLDSLNERADLINSDRLSDIVLSNPPFTSILYGGFPINFTGTTEVEALRDIQFTRALLFLGVLQALKIRAKIGGGEIPLSPNGQFEVVRCWLAMYPERRSWYKNQLLEVFKSIDGIASYERSSR